MNTSKDNKKKYFTIPILNVNCVWEKHVESYHSKFLITLNRVDDNVIMYQQIDNEVQYVEQSSYELLTAVQWLNLGCVKNNLYNIWS